MWHPKMFERGPQHDYIEYPGRPLRVTCWAYAWPATIEEHLALDRCLLECLQTVAQRVPPRFPRVIWRTLCQTLPDGRRLAYCRLAMDLLGAAPILPLLGPLAEWPGCLGANEEDTLPHADGLLLNTPLRDQVPYLNLFPWAVLVGTQVWIYGSPRVLPAPFRTTVPGRRLTLGCDPRSRLWMEPTDATPFPWTPAQWEFLRFAAVVAAESSDGYSSLTRLGSRYWEMRGEDLPEAWYEWWLSPLFHGIIHEGARQLLAGKKKWG